MPPSNETKKTPVVTDAPIDIVDTPPVVKDPHALTPIYTVVDKLDVNSVRTKRSVVVASGTQSEINKLLDIVNSITTDVIKTELNDDELTSIGFNYESVSSTTDEDMFSKHINNEEFVNSVTHADKRIGINSVKVKTNGRLSGTNAVAKFTSGLGIGKHTSVTLWHSGFTVVLTPPKESDIINLQYAIAKQEHKLGKETNNFIYSNYGVVINEILVDFITSHIIGSSLTLPEDKDYIDFIKLTDIQTLAAGMATSMRPNGYPITVTCKKSLEMIDQHPVCDFVATADVIPENLLWVNRKALTTTNLAHISKTTIGSHTVDDVLNYQNSLTVNDATTIDVTSNQSDSIKFNLQTPTLRKYIDTGGLWVNTIIKAAELLFTEDENADTRNEKIDTLVLTSILNKYNSYITRIDMDDSYVDDAASISDILEVMSSDSSISNELLTAIAKHIDTGYVSLIATYNFDCPKCKEAGRDSEQSSGSVSGFNEFIPLNAVEHFFDLSTLRYSTIVNRNK